MLDTEMDVHLGWRSVRRQRVRRPVRQVGRNHHAVRLSTTDRKAIYTTNAIESLNSVIRKFICNRKIYPNEESALRLVGMAIRHASQRWTMPIHHWKQALNHFEAVYEELFKSVGDASQFKLVVNA